MFVLLTCLFLILAFIFSMLGLGGAMVYNPLMVWFGYDFKSVVIPVGLLLNGLTAASSAWVYARKRMIDYSAGLPIVVTSAIGAPIGAYFTQFISTQILLGLFAAAVLFAGGRMILIRNQSEPERVRGTTLQRAILGAALGLGIGAVAGLLGVGGGFLIVPVLMAMGYPTKTAAATSAFTVVFSSFSGFLGHVAVGHFDWLLMGVMAVVVIAGSQGGALVMQARLKPQHIKRMFGAVLVFVALKMVAGLI
ncbi:MAG: sulfite exporter TauE/SafE family protein [Anaerolineales bacterium]|jgi:uncharacterized membrane protein YfcA